VGQAHRERIKNNLGVCRQQKNRRTYIPTGLPLETLQTKRRLFEPQNKHLDIISASCDGK
jgi:hypothetical protein